MKHGRGSFANRKCKLCGKTGFNGMIDLLTHRKIVHNIELSESPTTPRVMRKAAPSTTTTTIPELITAVKQAETPELQYSFYNSPKELRLDLGEYVIRVERKQK